MNILLNYHAVSCIKQYDRSKVNFLLSHRDNCTFQSFRQIKTSDFFLSNCDIKIFQVNSFNMRSKTSIVQVNCDNNQ